MASWPIHRRAGLAPGDRVRAILLDVSLLSAQRKPLQVVAGTSQRATACDSRSHSCSRPRPWSGTRSRVWQGKEKHPRVCSRPTVRADVDVCRSVGNPFCFHLRPRRSGGCGGGGGGGVDGPRQPGAAARPPGLTAVFRVGVFYRTACGFGFGFGDAPCQHALVERRPADVTFVVSASATADRPERVIADLLGDEPSCRRRPLPVRLLVRPLGQEQLAEEGVPRLLPSAIRRCTPGCAWPRARAAAPAAAQAASAWPRTAPAPRPRTRPAAWPSSGRPV